MAWRVILPALAVLLSGCLTAREPAFDASNSRPVGDIPDFVHFVEAWERFGADNGAPRDMIRNGARGVTVDGAVVVQQNGGYIAVGTFGARPLMCVVFADDRIEERAATHGVTLALHNPNDVSRDDQPLSLAADGTPQALDAFIRDQFANGRLACLAPARQD